MIDSLVLTYDETSYAITASINVSDVGVGLAQCVLHLGRPAADAHSTVVIYDPTSTAKSAPDANGWVVVTLVFTLQPFNAMGYYPVQRLHCEDAVGLSTTIQPQTDGLNNPNIAKGFERLTPGDQQPPQIGDV